MKKKLILFPVVCALLYVLLTSYSEGPAYMGLGDLTGATGTASCASGPCHGFSATASTTVTVTLLNSSSVPVTTYTAGGTYTIKISGTNTSTTVTNLSKFGFQVSAVKVVSGTTSDAGSFGTAPTGTHVKTPSGGLTVSIWEHYNGGGSAAITATTGSGGTGTTYTETIPWTAPSSGTGCITIYGILNAVNANGSQDPGDLWNNASLVVYEAVAGITGSANVCIGATTSLSDATPCGTWSSSTTSVATVGTSGVVTGGSAGTATISYTAGAGNSALVIVTVNPAPASISGTPTVCQGLTTALSDLSGSGTWLSGTTSVATVVSGTGVVTGVATGTSAITFTLTSSGCKITTPVTVNPLPAGITGTLNVCVLSTTALSDAGGGTWASSNTGIATIGTSGVVTGVSAGTTAITYALPTGCLITTTVTVNPLPSGITGPSIVCPALTIALTDGTLSGSWSSSSPGIASVGTGSGIVTGVTGGTASISYSLGTGCSATTTVSVNPSPPAISGNTSVCMGLATTLSDATSSGTWTSGNSGIAAAGSSSGIVTGVTVGTANITYTVPGTGCISTTVVTVNPLPSSITGNVPVCPTFTTTLSDGTAGGNWTSTNTVVATVDFFTGFVTGVATGTTTITYALSGTGCIATTTFTVNSIPLPITGTAIVCSGSTTALSDAGGGTWTSSNTSIATVGLSTGVVAAVGTIGNPVITYTLATGCYITRTVTINPVPNPIGGTAILCSGFTTGLSDLSPGGSWASSNTSVATVGSTGTVTGIGSGGTATITYTLSGTGCYATKILTVNPLPAIITGVTNVCTGSITALTDVTSGGTWTSSSTTKATVGAGTGVVSGVAAGSATISYTIGTGCAVSAPVTVNPLPVAITGTLSECVGSATTLSDFTGGGTWTSGNTGVATIGSSSGSTSGIGAGTSTISYTISATGCATSKTFTVNPLPGAISGTGTMCKGLATTLSDGGGGTWSSGTPAVATVGVSTGTVTGAGGGTAIITYTLPSTGCTAITVVTVYPLSPITGTTSLCAGLTTTLSDATTGGTWASSNTAVATIGSGSGFLTAVGAGTSVINYTLPTGCIATVTVSVVSSPSAITGNTLVCLGQTSALTDAGGGTWTSSNTTKATVAISTGVVTGAALGTATITYSLGTGCTVNTTVTVNPVPSTITGMLTVCAGLLTPLSDATTGGTWSTGSANVSVDPTGVVTGLTAGTAIISYALSSGCSATKTVTINPAPAAISGNTEVCLGATTTLSDGGGGTWSSGTSSVASIGVSSGTVTSKSAGTSSITYTLSGTGCITITSVTVDPLPSVITGSSNVCIASSIALTDAGGGTWSSGSSDVSVDVSTGIVTGTAAGTATITYSLPTSCSTTATVTVNPLPSGITGPTGVCAGSSVTLSDATSGGAWTSSNTIVAVIGSSTGSVSGLSAGTTTVTYTRISTGCMTQITVTVNPLPAGISGAGIVCAGSVTTLSDATSGGSWSSANTGVATIASTGDVTGVFAGTATIVYKLATGCSASSGVIVNPLPASVSGPSGVCESASISLSDAVSGGTWSSSNTLVATISSSGVVSGISSGSASITYQLATGCQVVMPVTVNPLPSLITGTTIECASATTTLSDITSGGAWNSSNTTIATAGSAGDVTGISGGTAVIAYTLSTGCASAITVTINPLPASITGSANVCAGLTTTLSDITTGGTWSSGSPSIAVISGSVVSGISAGTSVIVYTLPTGCSSSLTVTVNPLPVTISGTTHVCKGATTTLSDATTGGTWSSGGTTIATVVAGTGVVTGVLAGTTTITYTLSTGCNTATSITVNPLAVAGAITGPAFTCISSPATLSDAITGGSWFSSNTSVATVGASSGIVTGVSTGTAMISYSVTKTCNTATTSITVTVFDVAALGTLSGSDSVCVGNSIVISDTASGGVWTSSNGNATVSVTGTVTGVIPGTAIISYSKTTICGTVNATLLVTINPVTYCNTGVRPIVDADGFKVYPNPSSGFFIVEIPVTENGAAITIMDILGKVIERRVTSDAKMQKVSFNLDNMPRGSYMVKVNAGDRTFRQKVVIW